MSVKPVNSYLINSKYNNKSENNKYNQSFTGSFNPLVTLMDGIEKGGFAASFIAQDGLGMVAPRIYEGLNRNRKVDENGNKTGPLNWEFARREGIREILSGPSAFLIPLGILSVIKRVSGTGNNVHVDHIQALGQNFVEYAKENSTQLKETETFKRGYYTKVFENVLKNSTDNKLTDNALQKKAKYFADTLVDIETKTKNKNKKEAKKLSANLVEEFMNLRKSYTLPSNDEFAVVMKINENKVLNTNIRKLLQSLTDYSGDALEKVNKFLSKNNKGDIEKFLKDFNLHRIGTRVLSNLSMWGAVVGFYTLIPKLYNMGLKHDPGLKGLEEEPNTANNSNVQNKNVNNNTNNKQESTEKIEDNKKTSDSNKKDNIANNKDKKDVAFTGVYTSIGKTASKPSSLTKVLNIFEFNGPTMSVPAMLTLMFGFCLPPRYLNAKSEKEKKEILVRDITSFVAILFGAKAISRGLSNIFAKLSGLALNIKPADHNKGFMYKLKNYFTAGTGINVLSSEQIISKYSHIEKYQDGINGFFKFLEENGGNIKKVLRIDKEVLQNTEGIMQDYAKKSLKDASVEEIKKAFTEAINKKSDKLEKIYTAFESKENKFISRAKTLNSAFGFASTIALVPLFMMWLARYCENMTKKAIAKEKELKAAQETKTEPKPETQTQITETNSNKAVTTKVINTQKPTMDKFLNK